MKPSEGSAGSEFTRNQKDLFLLTVLTLIALVIRVILLGQNPPGLFCDEASTGYDAFSLLQTGRDQFGQFLPLFARSFGDYNEAFYRYLTIPAVAILGLTSFSIRLPAAIFGTLTIPVTYLLARKSFDRRSAFFAALLLVISPWHIHFSRTAFRAILFPFFFSLGIVFLLNAIKGNPRWYLLCGVTFGLSLWTYSAARVFVPLFVFFTGIYLCYTGHLKRHPRYILWGTVIFLGFLSGLFYYWISPGGISRASQEIAFSPLAWGQNYLSYFNPRYLFIKGDPNLRHSPYGIGQLHLFEAISIAFGIIMSLRRKSTAIFLLGLWLILYPIPAAFTAPEHALRSIVGAPAFAIFSGYGIGEMVTYFQRKNNFIQVKRLILALVIALSSILFIQRYFFQYPQYASSLWQYGMQDLIDYSQKNKSYPVFISDNFFLPHSFILFYEQIPPEDYQQAPIGVIQGDWFYTDQKVGRYSIDSLTDLPDYLSQVQDCLIFILADEINQIDHLSDISFVRSISLPSGEDVYYIYKYHQQDQN